MAFEHLLPNFPGAWRIAQPGTKTQPLLVLVRFRDRADSVGRVPLMAVEKRDQAPGNALLNRLLEGARTDDVTVVIEIAEDIRIAFDEALRRAIAKELKVRRQNYSLKIRIGFHMQLDSPPPPPSRPPQNYF